jgi:chromosome segregation ATPase
MKNNQGRTVNDSQPQEGHSDDKTKTGIIPGKERQEKRSFLLLLLLWIGLVVGGGLGAWGYLHKTEQHFLNRVEEVKLENRRLGNEIVEMMQLFNDELKNYKVEIELVRSELAMIQEELELTGESLTGTDQTRQSLQERMAELDQQLAALKEQLRKLEEAVRAL